MDPKNHIPKSRRVGCKAKSPPINNIAEALWGDIALVILKIYCERVYFIKSQGTSKECTKYLIISAFLIKTTLLQIKRH